MAYRRNQKRKVQETFEAELVQGERRSQCDINGRSL